MFKSARDTDKPIMQSIPRGFVTDIGVPFKKSITIAQEEEFDFIELFMEGRFTREQLIENLDTYQRHLEETDLSLVVHLPFSLDIGSPFDRIREASIAELSDCLATAARLDAEKAVVHPTANVWEKAYDAEELRPIIVKSIRELDRTASGHNIELCAENIFGTAFTIKDFDTLLAETDTSMTLDTGHARISGYTGERLSEFVTQYSDRISHVHLNDSRYPEDEHLPFGSGTVEFRYLFETLQRTDWNGTLSLEVHTQNLDYIVTSKQQLDGVLSSFS
jgi:sugar phosphate isomerase/epimerase